MAVCKRLLAAVPFLLILGKPRLSYEILLFRGGKTMCKPLGFLALVLWLCTAPGVFSVLPCVVALDQCAYLVAVIVSILAFADADGIFQRVATVKADVSPPDRSCIMTMHLYISGVACWCSIAPSASTKVSVK